MVPQYLKLQRKIDKVSSPQAKSSPLSPFVCPSEYRFAIIKKLYLTQNSIFRTCFPSKMGCTQITKIKSMIWPAVKLI